MTVAAGPDAVWAFLQDPARVAACLPGLEDVKVTGPGELEGHVPFGSGFLRGRLRVQLQVNTDPAAGRVTVRAQGGGAVGHECQDSCVVDGWTAVGAVVLPSRKRRRSASET